MKIIRRQNQQTYMLESDTVSGHFDELAEIFNHLARKSSSDRFTMQLMEMQCQLSAKTARRQEEELKTLRETQKRLEALEREVRQLKKPDVIKLDKPHKPA